MVTILDAVNPKFNGLKKIYIYMYVHFESAQHSVRGCMDKLFIMAWGSISVSVM